MKVTSTRIALAAVIASGVGSFAGLGFLHPAAIETGSAAVTTAAAVPQQETPQQAINALLSLAHGLERLSPENKARLERIRSNPAPYVNALKSVYAGKNIAAIKDHEETLRFERAVLLLQTIGTSEAISQVADWYKAFDQLAPGTPAVNRTKALHFKRVILSSLKTEKQEEIITSILAGLERMDPATKVAALEYIGRVGVNDGRILNELRRLLNDQRSTLYQDKSLKRSVELLSRP
jgi:hypothetical protein